MKKILVLLAAAMLALALAACAGGTLNVDEGDSEIHVQATGSANGSWLGDITISEGYGLCVNHVVEKGSFHVTATAADGKAVLDKDIKDNIADFVDVEPGDYKLEISANGAVGTVDVIPYDKEAQAQADATLDEALQQAGTSAEEVGLDKK